MDQGKISPEKEGTFVKKEIQCLGGRPMEEACTVKKERCVCPAKKKNHTMSFLEKREPGQGKG